MKSFLSAVLCLLMFTSDCFSQEKKDFIIGDKVFINSVILQERKVVVVIPPFNYENNPGLKYPVIIVLDPGNNLFAVNGIVNYYSDVLKIMPKSIIVGIVSADREKDYLPSPSSDHPTGGGAEKFLGFISDELIPYIDSVYPATKERCIMGHSAGGLFAVYSLVKKPDLFNSFLCIDPSMWYDNEEITRSLPAFFKDHTDLKKSLFISLSDEKKMGVFSLAEILDNYAPEGFRWNMIHYKNETHNSVGFSSMCDGFRWIWEK